MFKYSILSIALSILLLTSCKAQSSQTSNQAPKVDNYTYGEHDLKVIPFGIGKEINVGKINEDGTIELNWPEIDLATIENRAVFMEDLKRVITRGSYCEDDQIEENNEDCLVVDTEYIHLFKNEKRVGILFPGSQKDLLENHPSSPYENLALGTSISWYYSSGTGIFKANCSENIVWEGKYDFNKERNYDIQLKEGWNMVQFDMFEKEEWKDEVGTGNMEKKGSKKTIDKIPENINWYVKMF